jgi:urease accessory protein UreH
LPDTRSPAVIGRRARLELVFERRRDRTVIAHAYAEPPFRIGRAFAIDDAAYLIIVCSGPGVFAGDSLRQTVHVERGARVVLTSQSALQIHPSCNPSTLPSCNPSILPSCNPAILPSCNLADTRHEYRLDDDAELHCHWDPVIPFSGASLVQEFDLALHPTSRLYWSDALMSGRVSRGEAWRFRELAHTLRLRAGESLKYLERYALAPADRDVTRAWIANDANYFATALVHHPRVNPDEVEALHRRLAGVNGVRGAIDVVDPAIMIARIMAADGAPFLRARTLIRASVLDTVFQRPELAGRK